MGWLKGTARMEAPINQLLMKDNVLHTKMSTAHCIIGWHKFCHFCRLSYGKVAALYVTDVQFLTLMFCFAYLFRFGPVKCVFLTWNSQPTWYGHTVSNTDTIHGPFGVHFDCIDHWPQGIIGWVIVWAKLGQLNLPAKRIKRGNWIWGGMILSSVVAPPSIFVVITFTFGPRMHKQLGPYYKCIRTHGLHIDWTLLWY